MNIIDSLSDDYAFVDGNRSFVFVQAGTQSMMNVASVLKRQVNSKEAFASGGAYSQLDTIFVIPSTLCDLFSPEVGDLISDGITTWVVTAAEASELTSVVRCWCKAPVLNQQLTETLTIEKVTWSKDSEGAQAPQWNAILTMLGKIHESSATIEILDAGMRRTVTRTHQIYVLDATGIKPGMRINETYNVVKVTGRDDLGSLSVIDAVDATTPVADKS